MKKLSAILLIALFAFNLFGYRIVFYFASQQSDNNIEKALDKDQYNEKDLITIKIPMSIPYQVEWKEFERFDGEVNFNGKIYRYVKRKVCDGNLILLCLPDQNKMHLETVKNDILKNSIDLQSTNSKKSDSKLPSGKKFSGDYYQHEAEFNIALNTLVNNSAFLNPISPLSSAIHGSPEQPPEIA